MPLVTIDTDMCRKDGICISACPTGCLTADADGFPVEIANTGCIGCGHCVAICPHGALTHNSLPMVDFLPATRPQAGFAETAALMKNRRSVREFKDTPVSREIMTELLDVAKYAPTAKNTMQVSFLAIVDPGRAKALGKAIAEWMLPRPGMERYVDLHSKGQDFVLRGAPSLVLALADADSDWGLTDAGIAISYLELAAAAHGLGTCWGGIVQRALTNNHELAKLAGVPENRAVRGALMIGTPRFRYSLVPPRTPAATIWG